MTGLVAENWETYGGDPNQALLGVWAQRGSAFTVGLPDTVLQIPSWETKGRYWLACNARGAGMRRVLGGSFSSLGFCMDIYFLALPSANGSAWLFQARDGSNAPLLTFKVTTDGNITVHNSSDTQIATTSAPCIRATTDHKIQCEFLLNGGAGTVLLKVDGTTVINASALNCAGTMTQFFTGLNDSPFPSTVQQYNKFIVCYSLTGTYNSSFPNISGVTTVYPASDVLTGFTPRPRKNIGAGVLYVPGSGSVLHAGSVAAFNLGAGDYTLETNVRFNVGVAPTENATILGKWCAATNNRSYRLVKYGANTNNGRLRFEISTDGTSGGVQVLQDLVWTPQVGRWYNLAVVRSGGQHYLFIDGKLQQPAVTDGFTYFATTSNANFTMGGEMSDTGTTVLASSSINGMMDQVRVTPGVARYTATYTPTASDFPTSVGGGDANYASVALLLLFNSNLNDQSSSPKTTVALGTAAQNVPADGPNQYLTINAPSALDDRYLEAALVSASGVLTQTATPANNETVTLGATTYTYKTTLTGAANEVLIGANLAAAVANLQAAIVQGPGVGTLYGTGTTANASATAIVAPSTNQITASAITAGTAGNSIVTTKTLANGSWSASTLLGGLNLPTASSFTLTALDPLVTGVRWIEARQRAYIDAGAASVRNDFLVGSSTATGGIKALSATPTYYFDVIEQDPQTSAALTAASVNTGKVVLNRTA